MWIFYSTGTRFQFGTTIQMPFTYYYPRLKTPALRQNMWQVPKIVLKATNTFHHKVCLRCSEKKSLILPPAPFPKKNLWCQPYWYGSLRAKKMYGITKYDWWSRNCYKMWSIVTEYDTQRPRIPVGNVMDRQVP